MWWPRAAVYDIWKMSCHDPVGQRHELPHYIITLYRPELTPLTPSNGGTDGCRLHPDKHGTVACRECPPVPPSALDVTAVMVIYNLSWHAANLAFFL